MLGGHLHPACRIHGRGRDSLRLPCFVSDGRQVILPAFGEFTGGWIADAAPDRTGPDRTGVFTPSAVVRSGRCPAEVGLATAGAGPGGHPELDGLRMLWL